MRGATRPGRAGGRGVGTRFPSHPGQYVVLNSERADVQALGGARARPPGRAARRPGAAALRKRSSCCTSAGRGADARRRLGRFEPGLELLTERRPPSGSWWRTTTAASRSATSSTLHERTALPVVWDVLHHHCHDPDAIPDTRGARARARHLAEGVVPKIHYSSPKTAVEESASAVAARRHSARPAAAARARRPRRPDRVRGVRPRPGARPAGSTACRGEGEGPRAPTPARPAGAARVRVEAGRTARGLSVRLSRDPPLMVYVLALAHHVVAVRLADHRLDVRPGMTRMLTTNCIVSRWMSANSSWDRRTNSPHSVSLHSQKNGGLARPVRGAVPGRPLVARPRWPPAAPPGLRLCLHWCASLPAARVCSATSAVLA